MIDDKKLEESLFKQRREAVIAIERNIRPDFINYNTVVRSNREIDEIDAQLFAPITELWNEIVNLKL